METYVFDEIRVQDDVEKLILWRKRLGLKAYELAREIGVTPNYLRSIENYQRPLTAKLKGQINRYLEEVETRSW